jgi:hypothetical protein
VSDKSVLLRAQTLLGATPALLESLFRIAKDDGSSPFLEASTRQEAMFAVGDLVCKHPANQVRRMYIIYHFVLTRSIGKLYLYICFVGLIDTTGQVSFSPAHF